MDSQNSQSSPTWQTLTARIVEGHRAASGKNGNPLFPGGTLKMQEPYFKELGFDLSDYYPGTLNVSIAPHTYKTLSPIKTFKNLKWHPTDPPEDFSFFDVRLILKDKPSIAGLVYHPHPETKPKHLQAPDVLELLFPFLDDLSYNQQITLEFPSEQIKIT